MSNRTSEVKPIKCNSCNTTIGVLTCFDCESWLEQTCVDKENIFVHPCEYCLNNLEHTLAVEHENPVGEIKIINEGEAEHELHN